MSANELHELTTTIDRVSGEVRQIMDKMVGASQVSLDQRSQWAQKLYKQIEALRALTVGGEHMAA